MTRSVALQDISASDLHTLDDILRGPRPAAVPASAKPETRANNAAYLGPWGAWLGL